MFLAYLDSSGRPFFSDQENFVLASATVNEHHWHNIRNRIHGIKKEHFPDIKPENVEFHAKDMMNRTGIYKKLGWTKIYKIFDDIFEIISDDESRITIIASLIKKDQLYKKIDVEEWSYRFVFERLNKYLTEQNELLAEVGNPYEYGIMIMDSEGHKKD